MSRSFFLVMAKTVWSGFSRLKSIRYTDPALTPANWREAQPCLKIKIASREIILTQPTSTFFVYALGLLTIGAGLYFLSIRDSEISRLWWGISLLLWGTGALLAGTSYQAFGYEIKCAGRRSCAWTSWWEVVYLMFQQVSMDAMLVAVASGAAASVRAVAPTFPSSPRSAITANATTAITATRARRRGRAVSCRSP